MEYPLILCKLYNHMNNNKELLHTNQYKLFAVE